MNITNPSAFWLLFLLIIPILIHLFQFRRYTKIKFSNIAFLKTVDAEQKSTQRLKHILILISRLLFIFFFIFFLAQPFLKSDAQQSDVNLIVLDKSPSNLNVIEGSANSILEENMNFINQLHDQYPNGFDVVDEKGIKLEAYEELSIHESSSSVDLAFIRFNFPYAKKILLLSDFQYPVINQNKDVFTDTSTAFVFMPPFKQPTKNVVIDSLWLANENANAELTQLMVKLSSKRAIGSVNVILEKGEQLIGTQEIELTGNRVATIQFPLQRYAENGQNNYTLSTNDTEISFDNNFYFSLPDTPKLKVLYLGSGKDNTLLSTVFENEDLFDYSNENINNFSFQGLDNNNLVILEIGNQLNDFAADALKTYATAGNNLLIIPKPDFDQYALLSNLGFEDVEKIAQRENNISLQTPNINNPFFQNIFSSYDQNISMPDSKMFMKWSNGQKLLSYVNSYPFLGRVGSNEQIYLFAAPLSDAYTNFSKHGIFLPILYKIAFAGRKESKLQYNYLNESVIQIQFNQLASNLIVKLENGNQAFIPDQRINGNQLNLILPKEAIKSGFYNLVDSKSDSLLGQIALNLPKIERESDFYTAQQLTELFQEQANVRIIEDYDLSGLLAYIAETKKGFPLWKYFLILALLSLLAEVLIIRLFK